jgi:soluble lytic murein transglycosylase-like protein/tetratricopeptide (TPR) repeat protein
MLDRLLPTLLSGLTSLLLIVPPALAGEDDQEPVVLEDASPVSSALSGPSPGAMIGAPGLPAGDALPGRQLEDAVRAWEAGDLHRSRAELKSLLSSRKTYGAQRIRAWFLLGWVSARLGHHQQASANFYRVRKQEEHPLKEWAAWFEAQADLDRGHPQTAFAECDAYLQAWPEGRFGEECRLLQADALLDLGKRKKAIERFDAFLADHPDDQRREAISLKLAGALEEAGQFEAAANRYRTLYVHHRLPTTGDAAADALHRLEAWGLDLPALSDQQLYTRACSLRTAGKHDASYDLYCELDERNPGGGEEKTALGERLDRERHDFLWRNRQYQLVGEEAAARYARRPDAKDAAENLYWAVQGFSRSGRFEAAVKHQVLGRTKHPTHRRFRRTEERSALLHTGARQYGRAKAAYEAWQARSSTPRRSSKVKFMVGYLAYKAKDYDTAIEKLSALANRRGGYRHSSRFWKARAHERKKEWKAARKEYEKLQEEDPDGWYTLVHRNRLARKQGNTPAGRWRNGRWPGAAERDLPLPRRADATPLPEAVARAFDRSRTVYTPPEPPRTIEARGADGRLLRRAQDGWSSRDLFEPPAEVPRVATVRRADSSLSVPPTWQESAWWEPEVGQRLWRRFAEENADHWPELPAALELSRIGLGEQAGPLLAAVYTEVRDVSRSSSKKRAVKRWKAAGGKGGTAQVRRWAAILAMKLKSEDWRQLFGAAGYPASVSFFATQSIHYGALDRHEEGRGAWTLRFPAAFAPHVWRSGWENDVDPLLMLSIMRAESLYKHDAVSRAGALGLVQVMPSTGAKVAALMGDPAFRVESLLRPEQNIRLGTFYLGQLLDRFEGGQFPLAVGSYNGGPHNVGRWLRPKVGIPFEEFVEEIAFDETRHYVKKVTSYYSIYTDLYAPGDLVQLPESTSADDPSVINF